jgi:hypothetical protein
MTDHSTITPGRAWRQPREEGFVKALPSGHVARLRPVDMSVLLASGEIPDILTPLAVSTIMDGADTEKLANPENLAEHTSEMIRFFNLVCKAAFLEPRIVDAPQGDDEISIEDVEMSDRSFVYALVTQPVEVLRTFRLDKTPNVDPVSDGQDNGAAAEPAGESDG